MAPAKEKMITMNFRPTIYSTQLKQEICKWFRNRRNNKTSFNM